MTVPWPDELVEERAGEIAEACAALLARQTGWRHRRVETLTLLNHEQARRSVSVDFTVPSAYREDLRIGEREWIVPLALLAKEPLIEFDLRDESGDALPALRADENRAITRELLDLELGYDLADHDLGDEATQGVARRGLDLIERVLVPERLSEADAAAIAAEMTEIERGAGLPPGALERFAAHARRLARDFLLFAVLTDVSRRRVVKFAYDDPFIQAPGFVHYYDALGCVEAASYHVEVAVPSELRARTTTLRDVATGDVLAVGRPNVDRPAVYFSAGPSTASRGAALVVAYGAERGRFLAPAATVSLAIALLLGLPWLLADLGALARQAGPAVALVLSGSAVFSGLVLRTDEHPLVRLILLRVRLCLVASTLAAVAAAASLAYRGGETMLEWTWGIAAAIAAAATGIIVWVAAKSPSTRGGTEG